MSQPVCGENPNATDEPTNPFPTIPIQDVTVKCAANSQTTISAATGTTGETYLWSTGATTPEIVLNNDGDYWVTVTDYNGCEITDTNTVEESILKKIQSK